MAKYDDLVDLINAEAINQDTVRLTFAQVAESLGDGTLPATAFRRVQWWSNDTVSHVQSRAWQAQVFDGRAED